MNRLVFLLLLACAGCGLDPAKVSNHRLFVSNATVFDAPTAIQFAMVGNTRGMSPTIDGGNLGHPQVTHQLVGDIIAASLTGGPDFAVLMGDVVRSSKTSEWALFDQQFVGLIDGATAPPVRTSRIPVLAVAGDRDGAGDATYAGLSAAFPGTGANIGHGRVATWSQFDLKSGDANWRFIILDSNKKALGSRWREQVTWLKQVTSGTFNGIIVMVHEPAKSLGGKSRGSAATQELLEVLDRVAPMDSIKAIISAGPAASQALLPEGPLGVLHVGAGGGGAPSVDLHQSHGDGESALSLHAGFALALKNDLAGWASEPPLKPAMIERATSTGAYRGYPAVYDGGAYPTYGWWLGEIEGATIRLTWRRWQPDGTFQDTWRAEFTRATGWVGQAL